MWLYSSVAIVLLIVSHVSCEDSNTENLTETTTITPTVATTSTPFISSSTPKPENKSCEAHNHDCKSCVSNPKCYFCEVDEKCSVYSLISSANECEINKINYLTCKVNYRVLIIGVSAAAGVVILIIAIACCCCCCRRKGIRISKDDLKWARQRDERKEIAAERRKERAGRTEEIRRKYGLLLDATGLVKDANPYQKFDA